jgi:DNA-binding MarR family transcriptional regulator
MERGDVFQYKTVFSVPREGFLDKVIYNLHDFNKKDYKVLMFLLSVLNGWNGNKNKGNDGEDRYITLDFSKIGENLDLDKGDVKKSVKTLCDCGIIEKGSNSVSSKAYRFTF